MDHINNGPYQLLKKDPTTKIKTKTLKQLKVLYYYLKPTDSPMPRFYGQPKIHKPGVPICPIVSYIGFQLYNLNKYMKITTKKEKMKITTTIILSCFPTISEMFPLKMMR